MHYAIMLGGLMRLYSFIFICRQITVLIYKRFHGIFFEGTPLQVLYSIIVFSLYAFRMFFFFASSSGM